MKKLLLTLLSFMPIIITLHSAALELPKQQNAAIASAMLERKRKYEQSLEQKVATTSSESINSDQQPVEVKKQSSLRKTMPRAVDAELPACLVPEIQSIIRAYALNPLDFVTILHKPHILNFSPLGIAIQANGTIIAEIYNNDRPNQFEIHVFNIDGQLIDKQPDQTKAPKVDADGYVYEQHQNRTFRINSDGAVIEMQTNWEGSWGFRDRKIVINVWRYNQGWRLISSRNCRQHENCLYDENLTYDDAPGIFATEVEKTRTKYIWNQADCSLIRSDTPPWAYYCTVLRNGVTFIHALAHDRNVPLKHAHDKQLIQDYSLYERDGSLRLQGEDIQSKTTIRNIGPDNSLLAYTYEESFNTTAYVLNPQFIVRHILKGHSKEITSQTIDPDGTILTSSADKTVRIWNHDGSMRAAVRTDASVDRVVQNNGVIVIKHHHWAHKPICLRPDTQLIQSLSQLSFSQQYAVKELVKILEEMYWLEHDWIATNAGLDANQRDEAIKNIELVLFGPHADIFKLLPQDLQNNLMHNMRCKITVK